MWGVVSGMFALDGPGGGGWTGGEKQSCGRVLVKPKLDGLCRLLKG